MSSGLLVVAVVVFAFSMVARRLQTSIVTAPMVFIGVGYLLHQTQGFPLSMQIQRCIWWPRSHWSCSCSSTPPRPT